LAPWAYCGCRGLWARVRESAMKPVGKPDAGNPHVRFDERGRETGRRPQAPAPAPILDSTLQVNRDSARLKPCPATRPGVPMWKFDFAEVEFGIRVKEIVQIADEVQMGELSRETSAVSWSGCFLSNDLLRRAGNLPLRRTLRRPTQVMMRPAKMSATGTRHSHPPTCLSGRPLGSAARKTPVAPAVLPPVICRDSRSFEVVFRPRQEPCHA